MSISSIGGYSGFDPSQMASEMVKKVDANGDGGIDKAELKTMMSKGLGGDNVDKLFAASDKDGNGSISQAEIEDQLKKIGQEMEARFGKSEGKPPQGASGGQPAGGGSKTEASGSGSNSVYYDPADTNKDGKVSTKEENAYAAKHLVTKKADSVGTDETDKIQSAIDNLMKELKSSTKYGQQGNLSVSTVGTQSLFSLSA